MSEGFDWQGMMGSMGGGGGGAGGMGAMAGGGGAGGWWQKVLKAVGAALQAAAAKKDEFNQRFDVSNRVSSPALPTASPATSIGEVEKQNTDSLTLPQQKPETYQGLQDPNLIFKQNQMVQQSPDLTLQPQIGMTNPNTLQLPEAEPMGGLGAMALDNDQSSENWMKILSKMFGGKR